MTPQIDPFGSLNPINIFSTSDGAPNVVHGGAKTDYVYIGQYIYQSTRNELGKKTYMFMSGAGAVMIG